MGTLSTGSRYTTQFTEKTLRKSASSGQGSASIVFCGITEYQVSQILLRFRSIHTINDSVQAKVKHFLGYKTPEDSVQPSEDTDSEAPIKPSYTEIDEHSNKLRESC